MEWLKMKIYKICAKNCTAPEPIKEIDMEDAENLIKDYVNDCIFNGDIDIPGDDDEEVNDQCRDREDKAISFFKENGYFDCGDFKVEITNNPERPNMCGGMGWIFD